MNFAANLAFINGRKRIPRFFRGQKSGEPCRRAFFVFRAPLRSPGFSGNFDAIKLRFVSGAVRSVDHFNHSRANFLHRFRGNTERAFFAQLIRRDNFVIERLDLTDEARLIKSAAVRDDGHGLRHLQRRDLDVALTDRQVCDVAVEQFAAVSRFHVFIVRDASFRFAPQRNSALCAKTEFERPIDNRRGADLNADLIKPGVARFCQRLDKIERTAVAFFPIVKGEIADLNSRDALIEIVRVNRAGFERSDSNRNFESRTRWIGRPKCARQKWKIGIVL